MQRRSFLAGTLGAGIGRDAPHAIAETRPPQAHATPSSPAAAHAFATGMQWMGAAALAGGKGYADCSLGQMHYRTVSPRGAAPFLLLHQAPQFMVEFADVQPRLAAAGRWSIAVDSPGFGLSDPAPEDVTIHQLADNLLGLLDHLGVHRVIVAGHHTGASIAAAFAARHPHHTAGVVLHGTPLYTADERAAHLGRTAPEFRLAADGRPLSELYRAILTVMGASEANLVTAAWASIGALLAGPSGASFRAVLAHDLAPDLQAIQAPGLILSDARDTLRANDRAAHLLRPEFAFREFSNGGSAGLTEHPDRWAEAVLGFARAHAL